MEMLIKAAFLLFGKCFQGTAKQSAQMEKEEVIESDKL